MKRQRQAFTLIELLVVISIIALLISILLPALGEARRSARKLQSNTQIRGIQQGLFIYAQSNKDLFPGLKELIYLDARKATVNANEIDSYNSGGTAAGLYVGARYALCLDDELFSPDYLVSPLEIESKIETWEKDQVYSEKRPFFSYALPRLGQPNSNKLHEGRAYEWQAQSNSQAIAVSDRLYRLRNQTTANADTHAGLANPKDRAGWEGGISFNDNHVEAFTSSELDQTLSYRGIKTTRPDNIFVASPVSDQSGGGTSGLFLNWYNAQQVIRKHDSARLPSDFDGGS